MQNVAVYTAVHLGSRRIEQKMLQKVGGVPLCQRMFGQLATVKKLSGLPVYCMVCPEEEELYRLAVDSGLDIIEITQAQADTDDPDVLYSGAIETWKVRHDYMVFANASAPFLAAHTIAAAAEWSAGIGRQKWWAAVRIPKSTIWDSGHTEVVRDTNSNTFRAPDMFLQRHIMRGLPVDCCRGDGFTSGPTAPFEVSGAEAMDIDTPFDLELAVSLARHRSGYPIHNGLQ